MGKRKFIVLVNVCIVLSLTFFFLFGRMNERQLLIIAPVSFLALNIVAVLGLRARKKTD